MSKIVSFDSTPGSTTRVPVTDAGIVVDIPNNVRHSDILIIILPGGDAMIAHYRTGIAGLAAGAAQAFSASGLSEDKDPAVVRGVGKIFTTRGHTKISLKTLPTKVCEVYIETFRGNTVETKGSD